MNSPNREHDHAGVYGRPRRHGRRLSAVASTVLLVAAVGMHRILFRRHRLETLVATAHGCAIAGGALFGLAMSCVVVLIFGVVAGIEFGILAGALAAIMLAFFWLVWPWLLRRDPPEP